MRWFLVVLATLAIACTPTQGPAPPQRPPTPLELVERSADLDGRIVGPSDASATIVVSFASWCVHCRDHLAVIDAVRAAHPRVRILGVNYKAHEEYASRGSSDAVRAYVRESAPWLRVVPIDGDVFRALGAPPKVPTIFVFDRAGVLVETYDRRARALPDAAELDALLRRIRGS
ncbi:MAG: TlpA family protein disulfide reductase [Kofleriaceae bacterium]